MSPKYKYKNADQIKNGLENWKQNVSSQVREMRDSVRAFIDAEKTRENKLRFRIHELELKLHLTQDIEDEQDSQISALRMEITDIKKLVESLKGETKPTEAPQIKKGCSVEIITSPTTYEVPPDVKEAIKKFIAKW